MALYENELCAGCGDALTQEGDIVVCPVCGTPQHRACWKKKNACVNEALHADDFSWKTAWKGEPSAPATEPGAICAVCGTDNRTGTEICSQCNNSLTKPPAQSPAPTEVRNEPLGKIGTHDVEIYAQINASRYIEKFRRIDQLGRRVSWNWAAFLFSPYWFFYRKLYRLGTFFLGLNLASSIFFSTPMYEAYKTLERLNTSGMADAAAATELGGVLRLLMGMSAVVLGLRAAAAWVANHAYKNKMETELTSIRRFASDEKAVAAFALSRGGVSPTAMLASVFGAQLVLYLVDYLIGM